ncbi:hypothetical protein NP233_g1550 [Leucocoprinus birnbaumii]|uniref:Uncharacterized protein n=1 Tax=Leucocoprinus birnbaumii TaxID=56174 RepID=A0AAD5YZK6_9AGAR|nr:hypothetical protein NP233_g1550 [Leucocoprinus birnbaumii]
MISSQADEHPFPWTGRGCIYVKAATNRAPTQRRFIPPPSAAAAAAMSTTRRVANLPSLLFLLTCFINQAACKGKISGGGGRKGSDAGDDIANSMSSLDLPPGLTAVFAITIIVAVFTLFQLGRSANRLKKPALPLGAPTLPYDVGKLFLWSLFSYLLMYLVWAILYAVYIALYYGIPRTPLAPGVFFVSQVSDVLFLGTILAIVAHRQRVQLNPAEPLFNLKSFLDGWFLTAMLLLGIAQDGLLGVAISGESVNGVDITNFNIAYEAFQFIASLGVIGTAIMAYNRLNKSGISDNIIKSAALFVSPFLFIRALYRIIALGIELNVRSAYVDRQALAIADIVVGGLTSIVIAGLCLRMGALPKPPKGDKNQNVQYEPVKA